MGPSMHMLLGEYRHNLDPKKRLSIPSKLRKEMSQGAILTRGFDSCLFLFPSQSWKPFAEMLGGLSIAKKDTRSFARFFLANAVEVEFDSLGRILIPDNLKNHAGLKKSVVVAGMFNRIEIWDEEKWNAYGSELEKNSDNIAEKLGELGII